MIPYDLLDARVRLRPVRRSRRHGTRMGSCPMTTAENADSVESRTRRRMEREGIPKGTDDPTLLALGATPLPDRTPSTVAIVCYCPSCDYFVKTAVQPDAIGSHACAQCDGAMEVYIAQGSKEVVQWHG